MTKRVAMAIRNRFSVKDKELIMSSFISHMCEISTYISLDGLRYIFNDEDLTNQDFKLKMEISDQDEIMEKIRDELYFDFHGRACDLQKSLVGFKYVYTLNNVLSTILDIEYIRYLDFEVRLTIYLNYMSFSDDYNIVHLMFNIGYNTEFGHDYYVKDEFCSPVDYFNRSPHNIYDYIISDQRICRYTTDSYSTFREIDDFLTTGYYVYILDIEC